LGGQKVTVFSVNPSPDKHHSQPRLQKEDRNGVRVIRFSPDAPQWMRWRPSILWQRWQLRQLVKAEHRQTPFDLLETADAWGWFPFGNPLPVPLVTRLHGAMFFFDKVMDRMTGDPFIYKMELRSLAASTHYIGVSRYVAKEEMAMTPLRDAPVEVIYNAVDTGYFSPDPSITAEDGLIVFVNSIQYRKGVYELCQAMNRVCMENPQARLVFIGRTDNRPAGQKSLPEELLESVRPEYRSRVQFLGWLNSRQEVLTYLRKAQLCCYPSRLECFGIAPVEAMSVGKATVYSSWGPGPEVIEDGVSGLLCNPADPNDIAERILTLLRDPATAASMGQAARVRAVRLFDRQQWIQNNIRYYQTCCPE
jgi:glycosyltransferase involved in cell wall biosynthesis